MAEKIRLVYLDEEQGWQSQAYAALNVDFDLHIPENLPHNIECLWSEIKDFNADAILIDYRLNESGEVAYTGDEVIKEIHKHNKHLPMFIITSYEDNALIECKEAEIIRGKELLADADKVEKLKKIIIASVNKYEARKASAEAVLISLQAKVQKGDILSNDDESNKFNVELYLSELDLDSNVRTNLITSKSNRDIEDILNMAKELIEMHKK